MQENAWLAYYLTQCRNFFFTGFTLSSADFDRWVEHPIESILHSDAMQTLFDVLIDNVPCSVVRHRREMEQLEEAR